MFLELRFSNHEAEHRGRAGFLGETWKTKQLWMLKAGGSEEDRQLTVDLHRANLEKNG